MKAWLETGLGWLLAANIAVPILLQPMFILLRVGHQDGAIIPGMFLAILAGFLLVFAMNILGAAKYRRLKGWFFLFVLLNTLAFVMISHIRILTALPDIPLILRQIWDLSLTPQL